MSLLSFCIPFPNKATTNKAITTKKLSFEEIKIQKDKRHIRNYYCPLNHKRVSPTS